MIQETQTGALEQPRGVDGEGDGPEVQEGGTCIYLWLVHADVWQKTAKFCKAIILHIKTTTKNSVMKAKTNRNFNAIPESHRNKCHQNAEKINK